MTINIVNDGGTAPSLTGTGNLASVMRAAADVWQLAFNANSFTHTVTLNYSWAALSGGTLGVHTLGTQGGTPNREISGSVRFDNDGSSLFFADGTLNPLDPINGGNTEYSTYNEMFQNFGGGSMNRGRVFTGASGGALNRTDLFSVALHEIGHALGLSSANTSYSLETLVDNDVDVQFPLLFAGSQIPTNNSGSVLNAHLNSSISTALMNPSIGTNLRRLPTAADIFANAQLSQFFDPNYNLTAVPEPGSLVAVLAVGCLAVVRRRSRAEG